MNKYNHTIERLQLSNNMDYLKPIKSNEFKHERFGYGYDDSEPKTHDNVISKENYDIICGHIINDHACSYYKEQGIDSIGLGKLPNYPTPIVTTNYNSAPPPPGPLKRSFASERIPSESFGEELSNTAKVNSIMIEKEKEYKQNIFDKKVENRYNELMEFLTEIYYHSVVSCLKFNAEKGKMEAFMNFNYDNFKANMPTMGKPREIQRNWIEEMKNPNSIFLKGKRPLEGINYDCWGNRSFTVHFTW